MDPKFDENGNPIPPGAGDPGQGGLTPEQVKAELEKEKASRAELEKQLGSMGERLSQAESALNAYQRGVPGAGQPINPAGGPAKPSDSIDPLEDPKGYKEALGKEIRQDIMGEVTSLVTGIELAKKIRDEFFKANKDLEAHEDLVNDVRNRYLVEVQGVDWSKPATRQKAFDEIASRTRAIIARIRGDGGAPAAPPHFETGGGVGGGEPSPRPAADPYKSSAELEKEGVDDFVGAQRSLRNRHQHPSSKK